MIGFAKSFQSLNEIIQRTYRSGGWKVYRFFRALTPARCCYNETLIYQENKSILLAPSVYSTHKQKLTETNTGLFIAEMSD